jgi:hypothetical protein
VQLLQALLRRQQALEQPHQQQVLLQLLLQPLLYHPHSSH